MKFELLNHQKDGVEFLRSQAGGLLAFEQGLGKTFVAIESFRQLFEEWETDRLLVVCPNSLKRNWVSEFAKFAPEIEVDVAEGIPKKRRATFRGSQASVIITSYETARAETTSLLALVQRQRTTLVLDESHAAKNWRSLTSTAARTIAPYCQYRWLLSGTPVTNTAADLFAQVEIIEPEVGSLGSLEAFKAQLEKDPDATFARPTINRLVMRKTKDECLDLPEKSFVDLRIELPQWQRKLYDQMRDEMVCEIEAMSGEQFKSYAPTALARLTRLVQLACNPSLIFPDAKGVPAKFDALDGLVDDILSIKDRKIILWSNYVRTIETLLDRLPGSVAIYGGTPTSERQRIASDFQSDPNVRVLIANPAAAGTGFTLTAASYAIYESLSWRYDHYAQSQDRNHRIGQNNQVTYLRMIAADTIEEAIVSALERKSSLARGLLGDPVSGDSISEFTQAELCELLRTNQLPSVPTVKEE